MITPDFSEKTYTAEVLRTQGDPAAIIKIIAGLSSGPQIEEEVSENIGGLPPGPASEESSPEENPGYVVRVIHTYLASAKALHRSSREVKINGKKIIVPRTQIIRGKEHFLYDLIIAQCREHIVIAVPFHELAENFFVRLDHALAGKQITYERLDITRLVLKLGAKGRMDVTMPHSGGVVSLCISRCHLSYEYSDRKAANLHQVHMTGTDLGQSDEYQALIASVLKPVDETKVTPVVLGFALMANEVKKSGAVTDRHGNFKLWVAARLRRVTRLFALLEAISAMKNVISTTPNVPILLSGTIKVAERT